MFRPWFFRSYSTFNRDFLKKFKPWRLIETVHLDVPGSWLELLFSTGTLQGTNVPRLPRVSSKLRNAPRLLRYHRWLCYSICIGEVVWSFMFAVELAGSYLGHVPCKFWKVCLGLSIFHRSIMGEIDLLLDVVGYHWFVLLKESHLQQWYGCSYEKSLW